MVPKFEKDIVAYSLLTRVAYTFISATFRLVIPKHEPYVFSSPLAISAINSIYDEVILFIFGGLTNWDAQHYFQIASNGYMFEQSLAFFPLYPYILYVLSNVITLFFGEAINPYSKLILASYFLNLVCFTLTCLVLFKLSKVVLKNNLVAFQAALLFCVSPASVFFLASYTETVYSFLVFSGMLKYAKGSVVFSSVLFALASSCRSNGIINSGFILHHILYEFMLAVESSPISGISLVCRLAKLLSKALLCVSLVICPYLIFQFYGYYAYCINKRYIRVPVDLVNFAVNEGFKMPIDDIFWCNNTLPFSYSYVQDYYWGVGFLKYYSFKQIPNFALALPIALCIIPYSCIFLKVYNTLFYELKLIYNPNIKFKVKFPSNGLYFLPRSTFVFTVHALALVIFCLLNINVQVTTRILCSSSPLLYWISSLYFKKIFRSNKAKSKTNLVNVACFGMEPVNKRGLILTLYFFSYTFVGIILFSCNYPWT